MRKKLAMKICAIVMTAAMVGTMAGCGNDSGSNAGNSTPASNEQQGGADQASDETPADEGGEEAGGEEAGGDETPAVTYDFGGATVRVNGGMWSDLRDTNKDEAGNYTNSYIKAWDDISQLQEKYNITIEYVELQNDDGYSTDVAIQNTILNGECFADIFTAGDDVTLSLRNYLADITDTKDILEIGSIYLEPATWAGHCYGFTYDNMGSTYVLVYSREYLKSIGQDVTPTQMFLDGKWDYESCTQYLTDLKAKLPDGTYPFGIHSNHWASMVPAANGSVSVDSNGGIHIADENYCEALSYYRGLVDSGLAYPITDVSKSDDGGISSDQPWSLDDLCTANEAKKMVMTMAEAWQMESLYDKLSGEWGIVPFPWGSNVTCSGDYTGLSDNYTVAQSIWTNMLVPKAEYRAAGAKDIPDEVMFLIGRDWCDIRSKSGAAVRHAAWEAEKNGQAYENHGYDPGQLGSFSTEEDAALYDWLHSRVVVDWGHAMNTLGYVRVNRNAAYVIAAGDDARSTGESFKAEGEAALAEAFGN